MASRRKIAVFAHCGNANLGDDALFAAVVQNVRMRLPEAEIIGFTFNPEDSCQRHGIPSYPIRRPAKTNPPSAPPTTVAQSEPSKNASGGLRSALKSIPGLAPLVRGCRRLAGAVAAVPAEAKFLIDSYRRLQGVELLLMAGSQQLSDHFGGPWGFPYTVFKFTLLSRLRGAKVALLSVGAGPLNSPISRFFARRVLSMVAYRSYRDAESSRYVMSLGVPGSHPVLPDLVYSLPLPVPKESAKPGRTVVGINPLPFYDHRYWHIADAGRYAHYVKELATFADWLESSGHCVFFFATQMRSDVLTVDDVRNAMKASGSSPNVLASNKIEGLQDLVNEISRADMIVAHRYHGILFSLSMTKPVLGLIYHEKGRALMSQAGQGDYVLDAEALRADDMIERFKAMEADAAAIRRQIAEQLGPLRKALQDQYSTVLGLIGIESAAVPARGEVEAQPVVVSR